MAVVKPDGIQAVANRNLLVIGTISRLGAAADLLKNSPFAVNGDRLTVNVSSGLDSVRRLFGDPQRPDRDRAAAALNAAVGSGPSAIIGVQSPLDSDRSVVAVLGDTPAAIGNLVTMLRDADQAPLVQGDLALFGGGRFTSYRVGSEYTVGTLPFWLYPSWLFRDQPLAIIGVMIIGCILVAIFYFFSIRRRATLRMQRLPTRRGQD